MEELAAPLVALVLLLIGAWFALSMLLGKRVTELLVARLLYDLFTLPFRLLGLLIRLLLRRH